MEAVQMQRPRKVFISHSSEDIAYVTAIVELLEDIGLTEQQVVCSSVPEYGIPLGQDIYDWLLEQFQQYELHVLFCLSKNYYGSAACLNEMGAAWVLKTKYDSILLPRFSFHDIKGAVNANQISLKLDSDDLILKDHLNQLKDGLVDEFELSTINSTRWERRRDGFIEKVKQTTKNQICNITIKAEEKRQQVLSEEAKQLLSYAVMDQCGQILVITINSHTSISANGKEFLNINANACEAARWIGAIEELEGYGLIASRSYQRREFMVTQKGYAVAEKLQQEKYALLDRVMDNIYLNNR